MVLIIWYKSWKNFWLYVIHILSLVLFFQRKIHLILKRKTLIVYLTKRHIYHLHWLVIFSFYGMYPVFCFWLLIDHSFGFPARRPLRIFGIFSLTIGMWDAILKICYLLYFHLVSWRFKIVHWNTKKMLLI